MSECSVTSSAAPSKSGSRSPRRAALQNLAVSGVGFLADAYDLFVIDFVVAVLAATAYDEPTTGEKGLIASATLVGAVIGQLTFGVAADVVGRRVMFLVTALLTVCGSILSAVVGIGYRDAAGGAFNVFYQLALCRFFLGVGIGGEYPLSASVSSEQSDCQAGAAVGAPPAKAAGGSDAAASAAATASADTASAAADPEAPPLAPSAAALAAPTHDSWFWFLYTKPNSVACVFSMQGVGSLLSPLLIVLFTKLGIPLDISWRILLAVGAIPSAIAFFFRWRMHESPEFVKGRKDLSAAAAAGDFSFSSTHASSVDAEAARPAARPAAAGGRRRRPIGNLLWKQVAILKDFRKALVGTSLTWLLIDVTFYGTGSFKSAVVRQWFSSEPAAGGAGEAAEAAWADARANSFLGKGDLHVAENNFLASAVEADASFPRAAAGAASDLAGGAESGPVPQPALEYSADGLEPGEVVDAGAVAAAGGLGGARPALRRPFVWADGLGTRTFLREAVRSIFGAPAGRRLESADEQDTRAEILEQAVMGTVVAVIAIPGYVLSIFFIHRVGLKRLTHWGFWAVAAAFLALAVIQFCHVTNKGANLLVFGLTFLFTNFGPNSTTFILPTTVYPTVVRATCHGFSAAMGKVGGVIGTNGFGPLNESLGLGWLLTCCAGVAVLGALVTIFFLPSDAEAREKMLSSQREMAERADLHRAAVKFRKAAAASRDFAEKDAEDAKDAAARASVAQPEAACSIEMTAHGAAAQ